MPPTYTEDLTLTSNINNHKDIDNILNKCIDYINTLENYHFDLIKLLYSTNKSLEKILYEK